jgi:Uma2 family endonuclease
MVTQRRKMTVSEFLELLETNQFHELIHGEEIPPSSRTMRHQRTAGNLFTFFHHSINHGEMMNGPMDVYLDDENVVQPDMFWLSENPSAKWIEGNYLHGAPDLVVEILSSGTVHRDKREKFHLYEKHGVREYWMIDPYNQFLEIYHLNGEQFMRVDVFGPDDACKSPLLGEINVKAIFVD